MQRRRGSGQPAKRRATRLKPRKTPTTTDLQQQVDALTRELKEEREQRKATSDLLNVISHSGFDLQTVLDALVESATRLCDADYAWLFQRDGEVFRWLASFGHATEQHSRIKKYYETHVVSVDRGSAVGRATLEARVIHISDVLADPDYTYGEAQKIGGYRSVLGVPLSSKGGVIGAIFVAKVVPQPFTEKQIELVANFADQAVIAIENSRLLNELHESLQQQTATATVLKVVAGSSGDLAPVFKAMLENAVRICEARFGHMFLSEGETFRVVALESGALPYPGWLKQGSKITPLENPKGPLSQIITTKKIVHIADLTAEASYIERNPRMVALVESSGTRTLLSVPMFKDEELIGVITIYRQEVRPFTDKQIDLVSNFASQAVIAIENARLLNELRQRTNDLSESLEQQTATSEVLQVISESAGELQPVFDAMLENAVRICDAKFGNLFVREGDTFRIGATHGAPPAYREFLNKERVFRVDPKVGLGQLVKTKQLYNLTDISTAATYGDKLREATIHLARARSPIALPMLKDDEVIGAIVIYRQQVRPFTEKQIELVQNFAAQAVIAIENTRLLNELRESLEQQTATADVLKVISSSPGDLEPVFQAMLERATQLCEAKFGVMFRFADGVFRATSWLGNPPAYIIEQPHVVSEHPHNLLTRIVSTKRPVFSSDLTKERAYIEGNPRYVALVETVGARSLLVVPMVKNEELIGAIAIYWQEVRSFTEKQIELISNFAAQAVIAIDNARLLSELRESLQQQTATADVLKVISRSTFDLQTVLQTLIESAAKLCDADKGVIAREKNGAFYRAETYGFSQEFMDYVRDIPIEAERGSAFGRALLERRVIHIPDVNADREYTMFDVQKLGAYRTMLAVPMLRENVPIGVLTLTRTEVRPFNEKQMELVTTFADQAAIAIENVRLFESVEARTRELAQSLEDLRTTQDRLVQTQKLASLGQLTAGIAHEIKNPLNFVNNFSVISSELIDELQHTLKGISFDEEERAEIKELADTLRGNLDKVVQHGKRADAIVKNMLLHSREGSGEHRLVDVNALVEEGLNLAYHGARAEKQGFNIKLETSLDPTAGHADLFSQDITRVLLNLISNGFYAATKRRAETNGGNYEPTLAAATRNLGDRVEITIRDNGTGIPPDVKEKMFNPFFTTKPAGEGTGLGLSISHDIVVKQHGGTIEVETQPGEFTEIRIILPRLAALPPQRS